MISKQNRIITITNKSGYIYACFPEYDIVRNFKAYDQMARICIFKGKSYKFSANVYYSYYLVLHIINRDFIRREK